MFAINNAFVCLRQFLRYRNCQNSFSIFFFKCGPFVLPSQAVIFFTRSESVVNSQSLCLLSPSFEFNVNYCSKGRLAELSGRRIKIEQIELCSFSRSQQLKDVFRKKRTFVFFLSFSLLFSFFFLVSASRRFSREGLLHSGKRRVLPRKSAGGESVHHFLRGLDEGAFHFFFWRIRMGWVREYKRGMYHCTIDLQFDWFGISSMTTDKFCFLQNRLIQTSQTGGQWYCDTSPFSIPWFSRCSHGTCSDEKCNFYFKLENVSVFELKSIQRIDYNLAIGQNILDTNVGKLLPWVAIDV